ncbi:MAG: nucleoside deaminase [Chloroflexi bacterium]|nr:MAG: nucleoside deaminase [Chloroflexota bacterium]
METGINSQDAKLLRAAFQVALRAVATGNHPFGAILADANGGILLEAENTVVTESDPTGHAETNLVRMAAQRGYGSSLGKTTLYASTEPCPMCSGAIYWGNIGRVVYGLSQERLYSIFSNAGSRDTWIVHCRELLRRGERSVDVLGPALEDEAAEVHEGFWRAFLLSEDSPGAG